MTQTHDLETLVGKWLTLPEIAERLDVVVTRVHKMIKERQLIDVRLGERNVRYVPAEFLTDAGVLKSLRGTITVLEDAGFNEAEIIRWLFTDDDSLPGRPIDALHAGRKTEIRRRAQALAW
ncbi:Rv2175c family DNA-binding protein [Enteractinococcus fodinae]|uniref:DNA-binding transcriptional regulator AlpA n=1 Tax=Enteractinococcus fodinae TaxID=684663 RepID=A0ABU2B160_9MICC|nr:Rv2175c family DNA-binding protein [Enteractinococcus fodinae]MDR7347331.1 putative DNA-binding transcriptional regulator AlpA [Enteractinococcus fodinae]